MLALTTTIAAQFRPTSLLKCSQCLQNVLNLTVPRCHPADGQGSADGDMQEGGGLLYVMALLLMMVLLTLFVPRYAMHTTVGGDTVQTTVWLTLPNS